MQQLWTSGALASLRHVVTRTLGVMALASGIGTARLHCPVTGAACQPSLTTRTMMRVMIQPFHRVWRGLWACSLRDRRLLAYSSIYLSIYPSVHLIMYISVNLYVNCFIQCCRCAGACGTQGPLSHLGMKPHARGRSGPSSTRGCGRHSKAA